MNLNDKNQTLENLERAVHVYQSIGRYDVFKHIDEEFKSIGFKTEDNLATIAIDETGRPKKCRECGKTEFILIEELDDRKIWQCKACNCRNVVFKKQQVLNA